MRKYLSAYSVKAVSSALPQECTYRARSEAALNKKTSKNGDMKLNSVHLRCFLGRKYRSGTAIWRFFYDFADFASRSQSSTSNAV
jgi:hypothetical protein